MCDALTCKMLCDVFLDIDIENILLLHISIISEILY